MKVPVIALISVIVLTFQIDNALGQTKYEIVDNEDKTVIKAKGKTNETLLVIEDEIKFSISRTPSINKSQPALQNNSISLENGVFGLAINQTTGRMLKILGIPTSTYSADENTVLYSYGRNLWVVTQNGVVKKITTENHWVSTTLANLIAFDNRFNSDWLIEGKVGYETSKAKLLKQLPNGNQVKNNTYRISLEELDGVHLDVVIDVKIINGEKKRLVNGFEYGYTEIDFIKSSNSKSETATEYGNVIAFIDNQRKRDEPITLERLNEQGFKPVYDAYADNGDVIQVYSNHLVLNFSYGKLSKLSVYESVFRNKEKLQDWKFGKYYSGQPSSEIMALYGDEVMGYDDYLQVFLDDVKYDLYFVENDNDVMALVELEMEFF